ncbi:terminase small subunit [Neobacillus sp. MM2021_6]|uniref:terminase small subunit n=1 Tax=Bacillaceae TaxID=186817 RepID=UPI0014092661|nr:MULTISPECIES: terminase small subunit [Bacillaceae]MBO0959554.1 terminase small subunit [Neobacillus sp. MM2021_6]NHC17148.1 terminase small subunit [Bacillus sp. MM2020_4]
MKLTEKQQRFVDYYLSSGNAEDAAKKAGYNARGNTTKLLQNTTIQNAIAERNKQIESDRIADMEEVKRFWTNTMRDDEVELKDRLKASEYIAKTNAAFIEKQQISGETTHNIKTDADLSKLSVEELKELEAILSKTADAD